MLNTTRNWSSFFLWLSFVHRIRPCSSHLRGWPSLQMHQWEDSLLQCSSLFREQVTDWQSRWHLWSNDRFCILELILLPYLVAGVFAVGKFSSQVQLEFPLSLDSRLWGHNQSFDFFSNISHTRCCLLRTFRCRKQSNFWMKLVWILVWAWEWISYDIRP